MTQQVNINIPIIDSLDSISEKEVDQLMEIGFAYIKISEDCHNDLQLLKKKSINFFRKDEAEKIKYPLNERFQGFIDHKHDLPSQSAQNLIFSIDHPLGPFNQEVPLLSRISKMLQQNVGFSLIEKIFKRAGLEEHVSEVITSSYSAYTLVYYPEAENQHSNCQVGLKGHKDWDLVTVLFITDPGLEIYIGGVWVAAVPKPGYVVVNLSSALELMLGKRCNAAWHRVRQPQKERITVGLFIGSNDHAPLKDYTTGSIKFASYSAYQEYKIKQENSKINRLRLLFEDAKQALNNDSACHSYPKVGVSVRADDGKIYTGCNLKADACSSPRCAESEVISEMIANGSKKIVIMAILVKTDDPKWQPCSSCIVEIRKFSLKNTSIYIFNLDKKNNIMSNKELSPADFYLEVDNEVEYDNAR